MRIVNNFKYLGFRLIIGRSIEKKYVEEKSMHYFKYYNDRVDSKIRSNNDCGGDGHC